MPTNSIAKTGTFKEATEDLVKALHVAIHQDELTSTDREWLLGELDDLIDKLKKVKAKLPNSKTATHKKVVSGAEK